MKRARASRTIGLQIVLFFIPLLSFLLVGCGGGGGGGGGAVTGQSNASGNVSLVSITFPEYTDLTGSSATPPISAPLSQQVVLTFSGNVEFEGNVGEGALEITANPGSDYAGPEVARDKTKNLILARGDLEVMNNVVIFTPFIPTDAIDLSANAPPEKVPGLLPGYTYTVFVPVGTRGAISNLVNIDPSIKNPIDFTTVLSESLYFNYRNQPALPPKTVTTRPADGTQDFSFFPLKDRYRNLSEDEEIVLQFDQPLDFRHENLEGEDLDEDGVRDSNMFLKYTGSMAYFAVDKFSVQKGFLARLESGTNNVEFIGYTNDPTLSPVDQNIGLKSVFFMSPVRMVGCSEDALYDVDFMKTSGQPLVCELTNKRALQGGVQANPLTWAYHNKLYGIDADSTALIEVNAKTGAVTSLGVIASGFGVFVDLAIGFDGALYALRVVDPGTTYATASVERIDTKTLLSQPVAADLKGDFISMVFTRNDHITLFDYDSKRTAQLDLKNPEELTYGDAIDYELLLPGRRLNFDLQKYELGVTPDLLDNPYEGALVRLVPSGILPLGAWVDIMIRCGLTNISGGSLHNNSGMSAWIAVSVASFKTKDHQGNFSDYFEELFTDNEMEEVNHDLSNASALWNVQDVDGVPPSYEKLLASLGMTGAGELGDFVPIGLSPTVFLDTNYQPLPLFDGSTPGVTEPIVITNGEFHFHDIIIPYNVTIQAQGTNPLVFTATGEVNIAGRIDVSGIDGTSDMTFNSAYLPTPGGKGGPGGGSGGMGQPPIPEDFASLTQLQSPSRAERGWGPGNSEQIGGEGGESGAKGTNVSWRGSAEDSRSRGAGGGGGTYFAVGKPGYPGFGQYTVDDETGQFYIRDAWEYWDGTYIYDPDWDPIADPEEEIVNEPQWHQNHWYADDPDPDIARAPHHGIPGELVFKDVDLNGNPITSNDYIGRNGELKDLQGGQGGGGGGTRMDSMNPLTEQQAAGWNPPLPRSAYDSKGGGGGGGGGAFALHSLQEIFIASSGRIIAKGGDGGGGEVIGHSNFGGGGGGGSGGAIILNSATKITIDHLGEGSQAIYGRLNVTGGRGADARANVAVTWSEIPEPCLLDNKGIPKYMDGNSIAFCHWSRCDGGAGGHGIIQLMVPDPEHDLEMIGYPDPAGDKLNYLSIVATEYPYGYLPDQEKYLPPQSEFYWARYVFDVEDLGSGNWARIWPKNGDCMVDPERVVSTINPRTFAVSKWIDMGQISKRSPINGKTAPVFFNNGYHGFRGITPGYLDDTSSELWGLVYEENGFVILDPTGENDIDVSSPDRYEVDYIDITNRIGIQFQATEAVIPGSKVPDEDAATPWTTKLNELHGKQFIRFKVGLNAAYDTVIKSSNIKPQVDRLRLRFRY